MRYLVCICAIGAVLLTMAMTQTRGQAQQPEPAATEIRVDEMNQWVQLARKTGGYPLNGQQVQVRLVSHAQLEVASRTGRLIAFDHHWVGVEYSAGEGRENTRAWIPRENVATIIAYGEQRGDAPQQ